jgi:hypothetical protein
LKVEYHKLLSTFAFNLKLCRYKKVLLAVVNHDTNKLMAKVGWCKFKGFQNRVESTWFLCVKLTYGEIGFKICFRFKFAGARPPLTST